MAGRLEGKRIIITGAVSNIGKEAVRLFVAEGARVVIGDRDEGGAATAKEFGPAVHFVKVDVTSEDSVRALIEEGAAWLGGLDVLCQNAGLQHSGAVTEFDAALWTRCSRSTHGRISSEQNTPCRICGATAGARSSTPRRWPASAAARA